MVAYGSFLFLLLFTSRLKDMEGGARQLVERSCPLGAGAHI